MYAIAMKSDDGTTILGYLPGLGQVLWPLETTTIRLFATEGEAEGVRSAHPLADRLAVVPLPGREDPTPPSTAVLSRPTPIRLSTGPKPEG
jgi:hypothetical protein